MMMGERIQRRLERLAGCSEGGEGVTRLIFTPEHRQALELLRGWMEEAGLETELDGMGNLVGCAGGTGGSETLLLGSHQDSVLRGGRYDGALGIVMAIECAGAVLRRGDLPYQLKVVAFSDEEGVRFQTNYLGSTAYLGKLRREMLERRDAAGITLGAAAVAFGVEPEGIFQGDERPDAYIEVHLEQGPVLEGRGVPVGVVTSIQSSRLYRMTLAGASGHAGTVPMWLRRDAMRAGAECIACLMETAEEHRELVVTVGRVEVCPGATNVIPGQVSFTVDVRGTAEDEMDRMMAQAVSRMEAVSRLRGTKLAVCAEYRQAGTLCDEKLTAELARGIAAMGLPVIRLSSGAGHDAQVLAEEMPVGMLFVRCRGGVSHSPEEYVATEDLDYAAQVLVRFLKEYRP